MTGLLLLTILHGDPSRGHNTFRNRALSTPMVSFSSLRKVIYELEVNVCYGEEYEDIFIVNYFSDIKINRECWDKTRPLIDYNDGSIQAIRSTLLKGQELFNHDRIICMYFIMSRYQRIFYIKDGANLRDRSLYALNLTLRYISCTVHTITFLTSKIGGVFRDYKRVSDIH
jgi:hypothetical protein